MAGHSIAALAADFTWGPLTRTPPYRERVADPQRPGRVDSTVTQLAGTAVRIIPDASVFDPGRNSTIRRGCRDGTDRQVECRLSVRRADDTVLTIATLTFVKDDDDDLLVSAITLT